MDVAKGVSPRFVEIRQAIGAAPWLCHTLV